MTMLRVFKWSVMRAHSSTPPCFESELTVSVLLLAHTAQEMPEWERWEISREKTKEKYELRDIVLDVLILTGSSLCQGTVSLSHLLDREVGSLHEQRPQYPPTQVSGLSHILRSRQGETNISSLCEEFNMSIQHMPVYCEAPGPVQQNFSMG